MMDDLVSSELRQYPSDTKDVVHDLGNFSVSSAFHRSSDPLLITRAVRFDTAVL